MRLTIDGRDVTGEPGTTILDAARRAGIRIPTLCHVDGFEPSASCFLCAVQVEGRATLSPSCAMPIADGMVVHTNTDDVRASRKMALELLLSDHAGDCVGPCMTGCPAHFDIPGFLTEVAAGNDRRSAEIAWDFLTLPASLGRICPRLCEQRCHRCDSGQALAAGALHRFAADRDLATGAPYVPHVEISTGKRVAIVGAGPAGLTAAHHLLRRGHGAVLFDAHEAPGGMLRYGIPEFRLSRTVLDQEIGIIKALGGEFRMGQRIGTDVSLADLRRDFDAVFLAIGAQGSRGLECQGEELAIGAIDFLARAARREAPPLGDVVVVIGGGNTAMDVARTVVRLGARRVTVLYRRTRREMPCLMSEVEAAEAEGVRLETLVAPVRLKHTGGGIYLLKCRRMKPGPPDEGGRARSVPIHGSDFDIEASAVIAALGQTVEAGALHEPGLHVSSRGILVDPATLATNVPGVFAGGDGVTGANLAVRAVAAGKLAAVSIDQYLGGRPVLGDADHVNVRMTRMDEGELAEFFREIDAADRPAMPQLAPAERVKSFQEVELGFAADLARQEAARCMHCGCWKASTCRLRQYATEYGADPLRFAGDRRRFHREISHPEIVYEAGKCILCGACVRVAAQAGEPLGLAIVGRGFDATVAVPLRGTLAAALPTVARRVAEICPTGAFALKGAATCGYHDANRPVLQSNGRAAVVIPVTRVP
ncbi:MAG: FAD-dependent oxidoreductase [Acidobacteriota bacterium]